MEWVGKVVATPNLWNKALLSKYDHVKMSYADCGAQDCMAHLPIIRLNTMQSFARINFPRGLSAKRGKKLTTNLTRSGTSLEGLVPAFEEP
jgi:hypothetical protein